MRPWFTPEHGETLAHRIAKRIGQAKRRVRIASPVLSSGPILGTLAEVCSDGKVDVGGVVDDTQVDGVLYQWYLNGNSSWKVPALRRFLEIRQVRRQAVDQVGARHGARLHARQDHGRRRHLVHRQLQPLALGRDECGERPRDPRRRDRRPAGARSWTRFARCTRWSRCRRTRLRRRRHLLFCEADRPPRSRRARTRRRRRLGRQAAAGARPARSSRPRARGTSESTSSPSRRNRIASSRRSAPTTTCTPTSAPASGTAGRSGSRSRSSAARRRSHASRSSTPPNRTRARTRSRRTSRSRAAASRTATGTR